MALYKTAAFTMFGIVGCAEAMDVSSQEILLGPPIFLLVLDACVNSRLKEVMGIPPDLRTPIEIQKAIRFSLMTSMAMLTWVTGYTTGVLVQNVLKN